MMARRTFGSVVAGAMTALIVGCGRRSSRKLRYKITLEVETSNGVKTGASVLETDMDSKGFTSGQSPYVDLGEGQFAFALLSDPFSKRVMYQIVLDVLKYPDLKPQALDQTRNLYDQAKDHQSFAALRREDYPMLVTFGDINNPKTVREWDPSAVKRITFQVVDQDEPLTVGIEEQFKWAVDGDHTLSGDRYGKVSGAKMLAEQLYANSFVWRTK